MNATISTLLPTISLLSFTVSGSGQETPSGAGGAEKTRPPVSKPVVSLPPESVNPGPSPTRSVSRLPWPLACARSIRDQGGGGCIEASSTPTLGLLFPYPGKGNTFATLAFVGGGSSNQAPASHASIGGGSSNTASGNSAFVGGGYMNTASSGAATVGGGGYNQAVGIYAAVGGGRYNYAAAYSFRGGRLQEHRCGLLLNFLLHGRGRQRQHRLRLPLDRGGRLGQPCHGNLHRRRRGRWQSGFGDRGLR